MTSTTPLQHTVSAPRLTVPSLAVPAGSLLARLRRAAMTTRFVLGSAAAAARAYEGVQGPTARRAVLSRYSDDLS